MREDVSGDFVTTIGGEGIAVTGTSGADQTGLLFANFDKYTLSGKKLIDLNGNGAIDGNETLVQAAAGLGTLALLAACWWLAVDAWRAGLA